MLILRIGGSCLATQPDVGGTRPWKRIGSLPRFDKVPDKVEEGPGRYRCTKCTCGALTSAMTRSPACSANSLHP